MIQEHVTVLEQKVQTMQEDSSKAQVALLAEELSRAEKDDRIQVRLVRRLMWSKS